MFGKRGPSTPLELGYQAFEAKDWASAGGLLAEAAAELPGPTAVSVWFDAALAYKFDRNWPRAYELGLKAIDGLPRGQQEPAFWNLGIAATVLREWDTARDAWDGFGLGAECETSEGPTAYRIGTTCIRLACDEVVWAVRVCPTRARVVNVPWDLTRRFGEVVLHDGAPNGERVLNGRRVPVFDEIALFEPSPIATLSVTVVGSTSADLDALSEAFQEAGHGFDMPSTGTVFCKCCSEGTIDQEHKHVDGEQHVYLGAPMEDARQLLSAWADAEPDARSWSGLHQPEV